MNPMSPADASRILLSALKVLRKQTGAGPGFSLTNAMTLLAVCANPGAAQPDIAAEIFGIDATTLTRQLNMLGGIRRSDDTGGTMPPLVRTDRNAVNRRLNDVFLTPEGEKLAAALADHLNRTLSRALR